MHVLIYSSIAAPGLPPGSAEEISDVSLRKNRELGVTGFLVEHAGRFMQVLEGTPDALDPLFETIRRDPRHVEVELLLQRPIKTRQFGFWAMNVGPLGRPDFAAAVLDGIDAADFAARARDPVFAADVLFKAYLHALRLARQDEAVRAAVAAYAEGLGRIGP